MENLPAIIPRTLPPSLANVAGGVPRPLAWQPKPGAPGRAVSIITAAADAYVFAELERKARRDFVMAELQKAALRLGHKEALTDPFEARLLRDDLTNFLLTLYPRLTVQEFQLVFMLATTGELRATDTDFVGLNLLNVSSWFRRYHTTERPAAMLLAVAPESAPPPPDRSELPWDHPVTLRYFVEEVAKYAVDLKAGRDLPPLLFSSSFLYVRLKQIGALGEQFTGLNEEGFWKELHRAAYALAHTLPQMGKRSEWNEFKTGFLAGKLPPDNHFTNEAILRVRVRVARAWLEARPTADEVREDLLPLIHQIPFTPPTL